MENDFLDQLLHPSFVYAAKIFPDTQPHLKQLIVATACFDQKIRIWAVSTNPTPSEQAARNMPIESFSILQQPLKALGNKQSIYEADQLDDEALNMIIQPRKKPGQGASFDSLYPNCLCFSDSGRLFVGDSRGTISACDVSLY